MFPKRLTNTFVLSTDEIFIQELLDFKTAWEADKVEVDEQFVGNSCGKTQRRVWDLFDKPHTSWGAKVLFKN